MRKSIAAAFRGVNLLEYKNPTESLSVSGFYKAHGYVTLYAALRDTPITDITLSFVLSAHPREVIRHLKSVAGYSVEKTRPGIYTVVGAMFPIQFIDSRDLSDKENGFLRNLRRHGTEEGVRVLNRIAPKVKAMGKRQNLGAYLDVMVRQNALAVQEVYKMGGRKAMTLRTAMEEVGYNDELRAEEAVKIARNCIEQGIPLKTVATVTKLSPRKVRELAAETRR